MLRATLIAAMAVMPSIAMADKIVSADGDSFYETTESAAAGGIIERLNPISSAQAQTRANPSARPASAVPQMQSPAEEMLRKQFNGYYADVPGQP